MQNPGYSFSQIRDGDVFDVVVAGGGASGMTAALVAHLEGLKVLLIESSAQVGGTSSRSAGTLWIPGNRFEQAATQSEQQSAVDAARVYLDAAVGERSSASLRESFLASGPLLIEYLLANTLVRFKACPKHSDYYPWLEGARKGHRAIESEIFDGRALGENLALLRPTLQEFMVFGGMMVSKADIDLLLKAGKTWAGTWHAIKLVSRYAMDRLNYPRGTRLTMGSALTGSLLCSLLKHNVSLALRSKILSATAIGGGAHELVLDTPQGTSTIYCKKGLVLAGGGFSGNKQWREKYLPKPTPEHTSTTGLSSGATLDLGLSLGGVMGELQGDNCWWFPSSIASRDDGKTIVFPHILMDRAKPGIWAVGMDGKRFVNEGVCYHEFSRAQYAAGAIPCWLICDATALKRYGMGLIRPGAHNVKKWQKNDYLKSATSIAALAQRLDIPTEQLELSVKAMNAIAASGRDPDFGRGEDHLSRQNGDACHTPNPSLGPITVAPFYAIRLEPSDLGTGIGLKVDDHARLLDAGGTPVPGVYACGNDMNSIMGGQYPAPGVTLGPGMTFAFIAAQHCAASQADQAKGATKIPPVEQIQ
ncbi:FAD-dependent oxidoreductase [Pseudomonas fluorescens]|uniref:3-oxosteroid 1-dehydrogenase n=1 Tax=Pseudomonas fluorescens TaxID=294 RepID=A0A5E7GPK0_PSEFL|nr:FAD-dependent oxidoreductase [Pseudomonas fluorescens]VVO53488.1 3-oxosteroid 1-dehydrogenase [Pseudomonas fluorescens]